MAARTRGKDATYGRATWPKHTSLERYPPSTTHSASLLNLTTFPARTMFRFFPMLTSDELAHRGDRVLRDRDSAIDGDNQSPAGRRPPARPALISRAGLSPASVSFKRRHPRRNINPSNTTEHFK